MHQIGVFMKNLKPSNILIDEYNTVKITEFCFQCLYDSKKYKPGNEKVWMAPEIFSGRKNSKNDIWTVGAITYWFLTGNEPSSKGFVPSDDFTSSFSEDCVDFLKKAMTLDNRQRPSSEELLAHPWLMDVERALGS